MRHGRFLALSVALILAACDGGTTTLAGPATLSHGVADDILIDQVWVTLQPNSSADSAAFQLVCQTDAANSTWDLVGANGSSENENPHSIHAEREIQWGQQHGKQ